MARASLPGPARFLADGQNRTALLSAQGLPGGTVAGFRCSGGTGCATVPASRYQVVTFFARQPRKVIAGPDLWPTAWWTVWP